MRYTSCVSSPRSCPTGCPATLASLTSSWSGKRAQSVHPSTLPPSPIFTPINQARIIVSPLNHTGGLDLKGWQAVNDLDPWSPAVSGSDPLFCTVLPCSDLWYPTGGDPCRSPSATSAVCVCVPWQVEVTLTFGAPGGRGVASTHSGMHARGSVALSAWFASVGVRACFVLPRHTMVVLIKEDFLGAGRAVSALATSFGVTCAALCCASAHGACGLWVPRSKGTATWPPEDEPDFDYVALCVSKTSSVL